MRKRLLLSTGLAVAFGVPAHAESWYLVGEGEKDLFFADADSVSRNGSYLQVNVIDSIRDPIAADGKNVYYLKGPTNLDCAGRQFQNLGTAGVGLFDDYIKELDVDSSWQSIGTGTYAEQIFKFACDGTRTGSPIADPFGYAEEYWYYYYDY